MRLFKICSVLYYENEKLVPRKVIYFQGIRGTKQMKYIFNT